MARTAGLTGRAKIGPYAAARASELVRKLGKEVERSRSQGDPDAIHDLRVSVRRLSQCLDVFTDLFPGSSAQKLRKRIRKIRRMAGAVRDRDIAIEAIDKYTLPAVDGYTDRMRQERADAYAGLVSLLDRLSRRERIAKWAEDLGLEPQS
jgi:CHAD domain-containing protein